MAVAAWQLVNVRVKGHIDNQACDMPALWFYHNNLNVQPLFAFTNHVYYWLRESLMPWLTAAYTVYSVESWLLGALQPIVEGPAAKREYKRTREQWVQRDVKTMNLTGGNGSAPQPSFCAIGVRKVISGPVIIASTNGQLTSLLPAILPKGGSMRIPGVDESLTGTGVSNLINTTDYDGVQASMDWLLNYRGFRALSGFSDMSVNVYMGIVSKTVLGEERLNKVNPLDPDTWVPKWVGANVNALAVSRYVTSQVSRKRIPGKFQ